MKILVTGGTGFVGSNIARRLVDERHEVLITGSLSENKPPGTQHCPVHLDGLDLDMLKGVEAVFHQAAINDTMLMDSKMMFRANCYAPYSLFENLYRGGCRKFIYASSTAVYGDAEAPYDEDLTKPNPLNPYGQSKLHFEEMMRTFVRMPSGEEMMWDTEDADVTIIGFRYCNVYGPGEDHKGKRASMIRQIGAKIGDHMPISLFKSGEQKRDWIHVNDVVEANMKALSYTGKGNHVFNCGSGQATSFNDLVAEIKGSIKSFKPTSPITYIENPHSDLYQNHTECRMEKAKEVIGFVPEYDIRKGIRAYPGLCSEFWF
tara:strand:- start:890 stop:1843 length:954 start_codon:yes stop_codon:yes gene_type:complete